MLSAWRSSVCGAPDGAEALGIERSARTDRREQALELERGLLSQVVRVELGDEPLIDAREVYDVVDEVAQVARLEGAGAPVMTREGLVELDAEELADERGEAELLASDELRREHRVEDVREAELEVAEEAREVVVRPVQHLELRALEDRPERLEVAHGERVEEIGV